MLPALIIIGVLFFVALAWVIVNYNRMARLRQHIAESWSDIDVELKRRYELTITHASATKKRTPVLFERRSPPMVGRRVPRDAGLGGPIHRPLAGPCDGPDGPVSHRPPASRGLYASTLASHLGTSTIYHIPCSPHSSSSVSSSLSHWRG